MIELKALVATGILHFALAQLGGVGKTSTAGLAWGMGNRHTPEPTFPGWVQRAERAHRNLGESLPLFTILVLVLALKGVSCWRTEYAAAIFFYARLAHAGLFIAGITFWRTVAYFVAVAAMGVLIAATL